MPAIPGSPGASPSNTRPCSTSLGPALAAWRLPTPLGGTSTHFRTHILRAVHGWDAWNVTEDADLGLRLARAGYDVGDLPSSTIEEAPARYKAWLNQRTRWMKGFLQTSLTHGRTPMATFRELGPLASLCALALIPGTVVSALAYPFLMLPAVVSLWPGRIEAGSDFWANLPTGTADHGPRLRLRGDVAARLYRLPATGAGTISSPSCPCCRPISCSSASPPGAG